MEENIINKYSNDDKPKLVFLGGNLLYLACILEAGYVWLGGISILSFLLTLIILGYIVFLVNEGKKWARSLILFITIIKTITLPFVILNLVKSDPQSSIKEILVLITILKYFVELCAAIMLYSKSSNIWFNRKNEAIV